MPSILDKPFLMAARQLRINIAYKLIGHWQYPKKRSKLNMKKHNLAFQLTTGHGLFKSLWQM
jgi:hypothetical protein